MSCGLQLSLWTEGQCPGAVKTEKCFRNAALMHLTSKAWKGLFPYDSFFKGHSSLINENGS